MSEDIIEEFDTPEETQIYPIGSDHQTTYYQERQWPEYDQFPNKEFIG